MTDSKFVGYLIDTNTLRALVEKNTFALENYRKVFADRILIPVITYAEEIRGWVNPVGNDEKKAETCYRMLLLYLAVINKHEVLPYTAEARAMFDKLPSGVGVRDKRIAACALAHGYTVVTTNRRDFEQLLPEERFVDWTVDPNFNKD